MHGTVKFFDDEKGFGFIQPDAGGHDVFVHIRQIEKAGMQTLSEGQKVSFEVVPSPKKTGRTEAGNLQIMR